MPVGYVCRRSGLTQFKAHKTIISFDKNAADAKCQTLGFQQTQRHAELKEVANQQPYVVAWLAKEHSDILIRRISSAPSNSSETPYNQVILYVI